MHVCNKIPRCTCAGVVAAECALVIVDKQLQTNIHQPRPSIKGNGGSQPGLSLRLQLSDVVEKWVVHFILLALAIIANVGTVP